MIPVRPATDPGSSGREATAGRHQGKAEQDRGRGVAEEATEERAHGSGLHGVRATCPPGWAPQETAGGLIGRLALAYRDRDPVASVQ